MGYKRKNNNKTVLPITLSACCCQYKDTASWCLNTSHVRQSHKSICFVSLCERLYEPIIFCFKKYFHAHSCQTQTMKWGAKMWGWPECCGVWQKMLGVHHMEVKERRRSCAYMNSPGNVSLRAHGGWTACHRCHSWRSARPSEWSGASWACAGAWQCSYSGGTWAYWGLGVRTRLDRDRKGHGDRNKKVRFSDMF